MFVVWVGSVLVTVLAIIDPSVFASADRDLAVVHRAVRQPRRGRRRGPRQGAGRVPAPDPNRDRARRLRRTTGTEEQVPGDRAQDRRPRRRRGGRGHPRRRRRRRGHRDGRRVGDHRRVRPGDPRGRRRPLARSPAAPRCSPTGSSCRSPPSPGESFVDRMIALVEGAERQKTPNEIALTILLAALTIIFLLAVVALQPMAGYSGAQQSLIVLTALLVCLIPTTIGALLVGHRHRRHGPARAAQRARQVRPGGRGRRRRRHAAAGQDRHDHLRQPAGHRAHPASARPRRTSWPRAARLSSLADQTPEGRSIVELCARSTACPPRPTSARRPPSSSRSPRRPGCAASTSTAAPSARARLAPCAAWVATNGGTAGRGPRRPSTRSAREGGTPLVVAEQATAPPGARRDPAVRRRQARHARSGSPSCARWASAR